MQRLELAAIFAAFFATPVSAQAPTGTQVTNTPVTLPGDRFFPSGPPKPRPPGEQPKPYSEPMSTAPSPTFKQALAVAQAAISACQADGFRVGVAVIDTAGQPRVMLSAQGANGGHVYTGVRKALAALAFETPTSQIGARLAADPAAMSLLKPGMMAYPGAVPLKIDGRVVGAVGVSGAASVQDEKCAAAAAKKM